LRIENYFQKIQEAIQSCPVVQLSDISYLKRGSYEGLIRGELHFVDESKLHLREFVDVETTTDRLMYAYQYVNASNNLIFRYDNTGHHRKLDLHTYPHHKHDGSEDNVIPSLAPDLFQVLNEIEALVKLP
jgi:hypothetical protein